jgi:hypothetical protein
MRINRSIISNFNPDADVTFGNGVTVTSLAGTGDRMVIADTDGLLSTQAIPAGGGSVTSIGTTSPLTGGTITTTGTIGITQATTSTDGYLSSTDWNTFNGKQNLLTNPVTGTGTTNYLPKFTGASTIGDSAVSDNGTTVTLHSRALSGTSATFSSSVTAGGNVLVPAGSGLAWSGDATRIMTPEDNVSGALIQTPGIIRFNAGGSEKVRIDASGNLGLGVTPSAWGGTSKVIELPSGAIESRGSVIGLWANSYFNGTSPIYIANGNATNYYQLNGEHVWLTAPSGTAGNAISFTQAMTLDASGNLSIGTTSGSSYPYGGKLNVNGSISVSTGKIGFGVTDAFTAYGSSTAHYGISYNGSSNPLALSGYFGLGFFADGSEKMRITSGGNVGIGTTSPAVLLQLGEGSLSNSTTNQFLRVNAGGYNALSYAHLDLFNFGNNFSNPLGWRLTSGTESVGVSVGRYLSFNTVVTDGSGNPSTSTERMRITSAGNVLVGTTTDSGDKLQVNGAIKTAAPTGYTAKPYKLGEVLSGGTTATHTVAVEIDGVVYFLLAADSPP